MIFYKDSYFEWDERKNDENLKKHGISFFEAMTVFDDDDALFKLDEDHSVDEDRFIIIGWSKSAELLVVCHCYKEEDTVIRIFSAREANKIEEQQYGDAL